MTKRKPWTDEDIKILKHLFFERGLALNSMGAHLSRGYESIKDKIQELGWTRTAPIKQGVHHNGVTRVYEKAPVTLPKLKYMEGPEDD